MKYDSNNAVFWHSEIGATLNTYTHLGFEDAGEELKKVSGDDSD